MSEDRPILSPEIQAAADAVKDKRAPTRLVYAEDLIVGMVVVVPRRCNHSMMEAVFGSDPHEHGVEERTILEIRTGGDVVSMIVVDEDGEQQSQVEHRLSTVRVVAE